MSTPDSPDQAQAAVSAFYAQNAQLAGELLTQPVAHAVATRASYAIRALTEQVAQLRAQLDRYTGREVFYCTDANFPAALASVGAAPVGTLVRATDTGREYELTPTGWEPR